MSEDAVGCYLCGRDIEDAEDAWCFGCRRYICDNHVQSPLGGHTPYEHDGDDE